MVCLWVYMFRKERGFLNLDKLPKVVRISPKGLPCKRVTFEPYKINNQISSLSVAATETKDLHSNLLI